MKKLPVLLAGAILSLMVYGGDPADTGNFLAALQEQDPSSRTGALLHALENCTAADKNIIRFIFDGMKKDDFKNGHHLKKLLNIWKKRPGDIRISHLASICAGKSDVSDVELQQNLLMTLSSVEVDKLSAEERLLYFDLINSYTALLKKRRELPAIADFFDTLCRKYPSDIALNKIALHWYISGCFNETDAAPGLPTWKLLKKNNVWKKRITSLAEKAADLPVNSADDADDLMSIAVMAEIIPEIRENIPLWFQRYAPESRFWKNSAVSAGIKFDLPELFADADPAVQIVSLANMKKPDKIPALYKLLNQQQRAELEIFVASTAEDHRFVRKRIIEEKFMPSFLLTKLAVISSAGSLRDKEMLKIIRDDILKSSDPDPDLANAAGFISAELDFELDKAEKLLKSALKSNPAESAFLDSFAWLLYKQGKFTESRKYMGLALENRPVSASSAVLFLHAAIIEFAATGDRITARKYLERAEKLYDRKNSEYDRSAAEKLKEKLR